MNLISPDRLADLQQNSKMLPSWQTLLLRVEAWVSSPPVLPTGAGGWIHRYICPTHWLPLIYDGNKPHDHRCAAGCRCEGTDYDEAWLAWRHRQISDMTREVGLAYAITGERKFLAHVEDVFRHYVTFYRSEDGTGSAESWMVKGRVFNQALTEALWACPLLHAYDFVAADLDPALKAEIEADFFRPLAGTMIAAQDDLLAKDNLRSNYMAWINAVLGGIGYLLNDDAMIHRALDGNGGFVKHISAGTLPDGMQYEVTPYYHNFVVLAYLILAKAAEANGRDLYAVVGEQGQTLEKMCQAVTRLMLPDGTLADLADGSYWVDSVYDRELIETYEMACARDDDPMILATLHHAYARSGKGRDHWAALLFGAADLPPLPEPINEMQLLPDSGVAIMPSSDQLCAVVPFGAYRDSHSHGDNLSVQLYPFSNDAGSCLYGVPARRDWYQVHYAHNTLIVDGKPQGKFPQAIRRDTVNRVPTNGVSLVAADLYDGVTLKRSVETTDDGIVDVASAESDAPRQYDWVFHIDGDIAINVETTPLDEPFDNEAQIKLSGCAADVTAVDITITHQNKKYGLQLKGAEPFELLIGSAPGTSWRPTERRHVLIGRTSGRTQQYTATYTVSSESVIDLSEEVKN